MPSALKIGRNDACPCGSGKKYKKCCDEKVDWEAIFKSNGNDWVQYLSPRGKNLLFLERIAGALQFDKIGNNWQDIKKACTADAVRKIHESILEIWPTNTNIQAFLSRYNKDTSGLYIGDYRDSFSVLKGIIRHSLYSDKILIIDPFIYPKSVCDEYNPILIPEQFRTTTLRNIHLWFSLFPWIAAGIVEIIRTPDDFDHKLKWDSLIRQKAKYDSSPELRKVTNEWVKEQVESENIFKQLFGLSIPSGQIKRVAEEIFPEMSNEDHEKLIQHFESEKIKHPFYLEPVKKDGVPSPEFHIMTTGASYDIAKLTAGLSGSYLFTDIPPKWKEIELDRQQVGIDDGKWSPFAKAFQGLTFKYLDAVDIKAALKLRKEEGYLENMRLFLRSVWTSVRSENPFDEQNILNLAAELHQKVIEAEEEWKKIDRDLTKWFGGELAAGVGQAVSSGNAVWMAAVAIAGTINLLVSQHQRKDFPKRFPAAFFMDLRKKE